METANKLVTLADLKIAYDDLKGKVDMWADITSSLTFSAATWIPIQSWNSFGFFFTKNTSDINGAYQSTIAVTPGEKYRVTAWSAGRSYIKNTHTVAFLNSSNDIVGIDGPFPHIYSGTNGGADYLEPAWAFKEITVTIPKNAVYMMVISYGSAAGSTYDDVVVEKKE